MRSRRGHAQAREGGEGDRAGEEEGDPAGKTEEVAVRQRPTNNQLLCVPAMRARAPRGATPRDLPDRRAACLVVDFARPRGPARVYASRASPRIPADDHLPLAIFALPRDHASSRLSIADRAGTRLGSTGSTTPTRSRRERARCFPARPRRAPRSRPPSPGTSHVRSSRASRPDARRVSFFRCFSRTARPLVVANTKTSRRVPERDRRARRRAAAAARALDRARSVACASPRWTRFAYLRLFSHARGAPRSTARRRSRRSGLVRRVRRVA